MVTQDVTMAKEPYQGNLICYEKNKRLFKVGQIKTLNKGIQCILTDCGMVKKVFLWSNFVVVIVHE